MSRLKSKSKVIGLSPDFSVQLKVLLSERLSERLSQKLKSPNVSLVLQFSLQDVSLFCESSLSLAQLKIE